MNSKNTTLLIASILAFTLFSGSISVGNVYATGGLDDEEEEEAIEQLQNEVTTINEALGNLELDLQEGANNIQANCPVNTDEIVEQITEVIENVTQEQQPEQNVTETPQCPIVEEPQPNQTVLPPAVIAEPEQNETEGCQPIPEPVENETQSELEPIICPLNGELLGYTNTTSGEQLPISAGNQTQQESNNTGFLPPIEIPTEEQEQPEQTVTPTETVEAPQCNVTAPAVEEPTPEPSVAPEIEFDNGCGCYVNNNSTNGGVSIPLDEPQNFLGDPEKQQEGLYF